MIYRKEIDGLRALAVLAVIANHFDKAYLPSGHLGVDIFFVISGYVITSSLHDGPGDSLRSALVNFYVKRIKRLLPALILCVAVTSLVICLFNPAPGASLKTGIFALFGLSNLYLFSEAVDYFGNSASLNVFTHTWSLGVEEQFYLFFPLLVWWCGYGRVPALGAKRLVRWVGSLSLVSLAAFMYLNQVHQPAAFFLMPARLWELGAGALLFVWMQQRQHAPLAFINPLVAVMAIVAVLFLPNEHAEVTTLAAVLLTALLIASLRPDTAGHRLLSLPAVVYIGRISYSLYLWHWAVVSVSRWTIGISGWTIPLQLTLMLLLAAASHRYVEDPLRRASWSAVRHRTISYGLAGSLAAALFLAVLARPLSAWLYTGEPVKAVAGGVRSLAEPYTLPDGSSTWQGGRCVIGSNSQVGKLIRVEECTLGDFERAERRVLVLGNSFSAAFVQSFDPLVVSNRYAVTIASSWGASPVPGLPSGGVWDKASDYYWSEVVPSLVSRLKPGDQVFLINDLAELSPAKATPESQGRLALLGVGLERFADQLSRHRVGLAVLHGLPFMREANCEPVLAARQWFSVAGGPCKYLSRHDTLARREGLQRVLTSPSLSGKVMVVDLMPVFCPGETCGYELEGGPMLYRDVWSHPSVEAARLSAPVIQALLAGRASRLP